MQFWMPVQKTALLCEIPGGGGKFKLPNLTELIHIIQ